MKKMLSMAVIFGLTVAAGRAQGVFSSSLDGPSEVPPNSSLSIGSGSLTLTGNNLSYVVTAILIGGSSPVDAALFGPANPGQTGPMIFDLGTATVTPVGPDLSVSYSGVDALSAPQISNLLTGLDYINIFTTAFAGGEIRGQVVLLPEPSSMLLAGLGAGIFWLARRTKS